MRLTAVPEIMFPASWAPEEIAEWLIFQFEIPVHKPPLMFLHIPLAWREVFTPEKWERGTGHWPTFSIMPDGYAETHAGVLFCTFRQRVNP